MKKSNLVQPQIIAEHVEAACQIIRSAKDEILKEVPALNLNAVIDHVTREIIGYESAGDPTNGKLENKVYKIFGHEIPVSVISSRYKDAVGIERVDKTLNYDSTKMAEILETGKNLLELNKFFHEYVTTKMRALLPESNVVGSFDAETLKPILGKPWVDYMISNYRNNEKDIKTLVTLSHADLFLSGLFNVMLSQYGIIYDIMLEAVNKIDTMKPESTSVVSNEPFNPGVVISQQSIVNITDIDKGTNPIDQKITTLNSLMK